MAPDELDERWEQRANEVLKLLSQPTREPKARRLRNPELRKNLDRFQTAIRDVQRLKRQGSLSDGDEAALERLLLTGEDPAELNADALGALLETVDQLMVDIGDARLIASLLEIEYVRDTVEGGGDIPTWGTLFAERIDFSQTFATGNDDDAGLDGAKRMLSLLLRARHVEYARRRARDTTKAQRLFWLTPVVTALAIVLIVVAAWVGEDTSWREGLLAAISGAVGATLAAVLKLRDQAAQHLRELRTFWYAFPLQIPLGAIAGLFLWIVLESGLVEVGGSGEDWAIASTVAFVAGFSEPFLLRTVERIAGGYEEGQTKTSRQPPG